MVFSILLYQIVNPIAITSNYHRNIVNQYEYSTNFLYCLQVSQGQGVTGFDDWSWTWWSRGRQGLMTGAGHGVDRDDRESGKRQGYSDFLNGMSGGTNPVVICWQGQTQASCSGQGYTIHARLILGLGLNYTCQLNIRFRAILIHASLILGLGLYYTCQLDVRFRVILIHDSLILGLGLYIHASLILGLGLR